MSDLRQALEAALLESPDDRATCAAYADYLAEQGDPRGELVQVQLALEDGATSPAERKRLHTREKRLLKQHESDWLGPLARWLIDSEAGELQEGYYRDGAKYVHSWHRGFLGRIEVTQLSQRFVQALAEAPAARLLRELILQHDPTHWQGHEESPPPPRAPTPPTARRHLAVHDLIGAPCLRNLRVFQMGTAEESEYSCMNYTAGLEKVIEGMPRIEELHLFTKSYDVGAVFDLPNLSNLRLLWADALEGYPLERLAANPAVANLTSLGFHPHFSEDSWDGRDDSGAGFLPLSRFAALVASPYLKKLTHLRFRLSSMGDEGIALLIQSGWLKALKVLDLRHGRVTDEGARLLAGCADLANLELLDLSGNQLTDEGIRVLKRTKVRLSCENQAAVGSAEYLGEGDFE
jgi:uncharacterized protein (TIGR02996 family)